MEEKVKPLRGYSEERIFYVYYHKRPDGSVFYVGKGHGNRAWVKKSRNKHWNNVVNKYGTFDVEIIASELSEQEAFDKERELILYIGMDNLTNQTIGGISTTGFRHSEETKKLQSEIVRKQLEENPQRAEDNYRRLQELHDKQKNDLEYKKQMSEKQIEVYKNLSEEEKLRRALQKSEWAKRPENAKLLSDRMTAYYSNPDHREKISKQMKEHWASLTDEQRQAISKRSSEFINSPEQRAKLVEAVSIKTVVNRMFVFSSKEQFVNSINSFQAPLFEAFRTGKDKFGFNFAVLSGYFVENYSEEIHSNIKEWDGEEIPKLNFDCFPRRKAVVMDESRVFLSMREASIFCNGKTIDATADFITKNMKRNKPAMGHIWREATNEEIKNEILSRVEKLKEEYYNV